MAFKDQVAFGQGIIEEGPLLVFLTSVEAVLRLSLGFTVYGRSFSHSLKTMAYFDSQRHITRSGQQKKVLSKTPDHGLSEYTMKSDHSLNTASPEAVFQM